MSELRPLPGKKVIKALQRKGFLIMRQTGSHVFLKHEDGRSTTVPIHGGSDIPRPTLRNIVVKQAKLTEQAFLDAL